MRKLIAILTCAGVIASAQAQWQALAPSPLGLVITAGQWLLFNNKRVYYIEVRGQGRSAEEARMNGFRLAVEQALGSVIASETEQHNSRIRRDEVISYAAGFVERYEIVTTTSTGSGYEIAMRVWIQRTNLAERLLVKDRDSGTVDSARAVAAIDTAQYSRMQGDRVLTTVLNDFPRRSFVVQLQPTRIEINAYRATELIVPFDITWDQRYLNSFFSAQKSTSTCGWNGCVMDQPSLDLITDHLINSRPQVQITIMSKQKQVLHQVCYDYEALTHSASNSDRYFVEVQNFGKSRPWIRQNMRLHSRLALPVDSQNLSQLDQIEVQVVRATACSNQALAHHKY
jgi:hypothetical protein